VDESNRYSASTELEKLKSIIHAREIVQLQKVGMLSIFPHKEQAFVISIIIRSLTAEGISSSSHGGTPLSSVSCLIDEEKIPDATTVY